MLSKTRKIQNGDPLLLLSEMAEKSTKFRRSIGEARKVHADVRLLIHRIIIKEGVVEAIRALFEIRDIYIYKQYRYGKHTATYKLRHLPAESAKKILEARRIKIG